jgi:hypothetical protein
MQHMQWIFVVFLIFLNFLDKHKTRHHSCQTHRDHALPVMEATQGLAQWSRSDHKVVTHTQSPSQKKRQVPGSYASLSSFHAVAPLNPPIP